MSAPRFFRARLAKLGPFVGVKVFFGPPLVDGELLDRSPRLQAQVEVETTGRAVLHLGEDGVPVEIDGLTLRNIEGCTEAVYRFLVADAAHAREWRPDHPKANPRKPVDWLRTRLPF